MDVGQAKLIVRAISRILDGAGDGSPLSSLSYAESIRILEESELLGLAVRQSLDIPSDVFDSLRKSDPHSTKYCDVLRNIGIVGVDRFGNFRMLMPPLLNRRNVRSTQVYDSFKLLLKAHYRDVSPPEINGKMVFCYKRYSPFMTVQSTCDSENISTRKVTNAVCETLGIADNSGSAEFFYCSVKSGYNASELTVVPEGMFAEYLGEKAVQTPVIFDNEGHQIDIKYEAYKPKDMG